MTEVTEGSPPDPATRPRSPRVWFVDVLRLIASFQMVNGHTLAALMAEDLTVTHPTYRSFRGLISVAFLAVSGIAFHLSTLCRFDRHKANPSAVRRRFRRAFFIVLVGYFLRFPWRLFSADPAARAESILGASLTDVLHCIGLTLLLLESLTLLATRARQVVVASAVLGGVMILGAPLMDLQLDPERPHFVLNWLGHQGGSLFPLFPWAGFVFVGLVVGAVVFPEAGRTPFRTVFGRLLLLTALTFVAYALTAPLESLLYDPLRHHAATNPRLAIWKLGVVLAFLAVLALGCRRLRALPGFLASLSQETLTIYALHLVLLYYPLIGLARHFGGELGLGRALLGSAWLMFATLSLALVWHRFKAGRTGRRLVPRKGSSGAD